MEGAAYKNNRAPAGAGLILPLVIFLAAFAVRFLYVYELKSDILSNCLVLDPKHYSDWGMRIAQGDWLGGNTVFDMTPLYAYFLGAIYRFITTDLLFIRIIQSLAGSLSCVLVYSIARELLGGRALPLVAGLAAALYAPFVFYDGMIMKPVFEIFFVLLMAWFLVKHPSRPLAFSFLAGASLTVAALFRENVILLIPVIPVWFWISGKDITKKQKLGASVLFLAGVFITLAPVTLRNYYVGREFVLITSGGGENFYLGNNLETDGTYIPPAFVRPTPELEHEDFRRRANELTGKDLTRKEASDFWVNEGKKFIKENPGRFIWLLGRKFVIFWNFYELPDNQNYYFNRSASKVLGSPLLNFGVVAPFGMLGMLLAIPRLRKLSLAYIIFLTYMASVLIFFNLARYRILAVPFVMIFGAYAAGWLYERVRAKKFPQAAAALAALAGLFVFSNYNVLGKDPYGFKFDTQYTNLGNCEAEKGRLKEAFVYYKKALDINPRYSSAYTGVGNLYLQSGDGQMAEKAFTRAIQENPYSANAYCGLGTVLSSRGDTEAALAVLRKAVEIEPENPSYLTNLGFALNGGGAYPEAAAVFEKAASAQPPFANAYYGLAMVAENTGRTDDARRYWEKFIEVSPQPEWKAKARERLDRLNAR